MKFGIGVTIIASVFGYFAIAPTAQAEMRGDAAPSLDLSAQAQGSYIFTLSSSVSAAQIPNRAAELAAQGGGSLRHVYTTALKGFSANMSAVAAQQLMARNDDIIAVERNGVAQIGKGPPPGKGPGGGGDDPGGGQLTPLGIDRAGGSADGTGRTAWVIDTGVDLDHPDLNVDLGRSANFVLRGKSSPDDGNGHGTHVAGTIGALDNDIGVVGVAAGAQIVAVRVFDKSGSGLNDWVIAGVDYVALLASHEDVVNLSLTAKSTALKDAVGNAARSGIRFAIAAGNSGQDIAGTELASIDMPGVYIVSAVDSNDQFAYFSSYGASVDYAAPGVSVLSTKKGGGTTTKSGTSMSAPHVAGILLIRQDTSFVECGLALGDPYAPADPVACHAAPVVASGS